MMKHMNLDERRATLPMQSAPTQTRRVFFSVRLIAGVAIASLAVGCSPANPAATTAAGMALEISPGEASTLLSQGAFLLDVRTPEEYAQGHIAGSTLIPLDTLSSRLNELPREGIILVICRSGARSARARDLLLASGFSQVSSIQGGFQAWIDLGLPQE
jgi:rhodanese-related sulfurtransferase